MNPLRVWNVINSSSKIFGVASIDEATKLIARLTQEQLQNPAVQFNAFGLEELSNNCWYEWYSEKGESILEYMESINA